MVRRKQGPDQYWQVKSSNYGSAVIDEDWLLTSVTSSGRSPLQHFHATWRQMRDAGNPFELALLTNRGFDPADPILQLRDLKTEKIDVAALTAAGPRSNAGRERQRWASHLGADDDELADFLRSLSWKSGRSRVQLGPAGPAPDAPGRPAVRRRRRHHGKGSRPRLGHRRRRAA